jgi:hypothetical protein
MLLKDGNHLCFPAGPWGPILFLTPLASATGAEDGSNSNQQELNGFKGNQAAPVYKIHSRRNRRAKLMAAVTRWTAIQSADV